MLLPIRHLIRPTTYFATAFDISPFDKVNRFETFTIVFKCGNCDAAIESEPLMQKGRSLSQDRPITGIDEAEFSQRCKRLTEERGMSLLLTMEQTCSGCGANHLILFGYREWQPGRDMLELGAIYLMNASAK